MERDELIALIEYAISKNSWGLVGADTSVGWNMANETYDAIEAAGLRVVPYEPTRAMKNAALDVYDDSISRMLDEENDLCDGDTAKSEAFSTIQAYKAMLDAAKDE